MKSILKREFIWENRAGLKLSLELVSFLFLYIKAVPLGPP